MADYMGAVKRPFSDFKKLSIGALMYLIPFVSIITGFFAYGYSLMCAKAPTGRLPEWKNWGDLFVKGLLALIAIFIYAIPVMIIAILVGGMAYLGQLQSGDVSALTAIGPAMLVMVLLFLLLSLISPMVVLHYIQAFKFGDAFNFSSIFRKAFMPKYLAAWLFVLVYSIVLGIVVSLVSAILAFTFVIPFILNAYLIIAVVITAMSIYGQVWNELK